MKKQYKSSVTKNHKIIQKYFLKLFFRFCARIKKKKKKKMWKNQVTNDA